MMKNQEGFTLVEVLVAIMILSFGILAMGASTGYILSQIRAAEFRTERMAAVREAAEILRGTDWSDLETTCTPGSSFNVGQYDVQCAVSRPSDNLKRVQLISVGPGYKGRQVAMTVRDTLAISLARPVQ